MLSLLARKLPGFHRVVGLVGIALQQGLGDVKKDLTNLLISSFEPPWIISEIFRGTFYGK